MNDLQDLMTYFEATPEERDYGIVGDIVPDAGGAASCGYCNQCQPCATGLQVGLIFKFYALALSVDGLARDLYAHLELHASDCIGCGHCDRRCPFHVAQSARMQEIAAYFEK